MDPKACWFRVNPQDEWRGGILYAFVPETREIPMLGNGGSSSPMTCLGIVPVGIIEADGSLLSIPISQISFASVP